MAPARNPSVLIIYPRQRESQSNSDAPEAAFSPVPERSPGSCEGHGQPVSRILSTVIKTTAGRPFICDACFQTPIAAYPDLLSQSRSANAPHEIPIRHCSRWGLPCQSGCPARGGLLPHRFTLARLPGRSVLCGAFPRITPAGRYPAPSLCGVRTFL